MFRYLLTTLLLMCTILTFGQETKEIITRYKKSKAIMERYTVLKADKKVKYGTYKMYHENGFTKVEGNYYNDKKKGIWTTFTDKGEIESAGNYVDGEKTGQWQYFRENGQVLERYDHDQDMALPPIVRPETKWPYQASMRDVKGTVFISYEVNADCSLGEITVVRGLGYGCDEEAIRMTKVKHEFEMKYRAEEGPCQAGARDYPVKFSAAGY